MMAKVTRQCPQTTTFWRERRAEAVSNRGPSAYQPNALPLGQTGDWTEQLGLILSQRRLWAEAEDWLAHRTNG